MKNIHHETRYFTTPRSSQKYLNVSSMKIREKIDLVLKLANTEKDEPVDSFPVIK